MNENSTGDVENAQPKPDTDSEYITGFRLFAVLFGVSLVGFLITLDTTIVATVFLHCQKQYTSILTQEGNPKNNQSL